MASVWTVGLAKSAAIFSARDWVRLDDEDGGCALLDEVAGGQLGHLSCADEEDGLALQGAEDLAGEVDGYGGDGDGAGADLGFGADFFGDGEGALEEGFELVETAPTSRAMV